MKNKKVKIKREELLSALNDKCKQLKECYSVHELGYKDAFSRGVKHAVTLMGEYIETIRDEKEDLHEGVS